MASNGQHRFSGDEAPDKKPVTRQGFRTMLGIFRFILPYRWYFIAGMLFLFLSAMATLTFPYFLGELVDAAVPGLSESFRMPQAGQALLPEARQGLMSGFSINQIALVLAAILVVQGFFGFLRVYLFAQVSERSMADIRLAVYRKLLTMKLFYFEQRRVGELTSRLSSDITQLQDVLSYTLAEFIRQLLTLVVGISLMVGIISAKLTLFMVATFPVVIIVALVFGRFIRRLSKQTQDELAASNTIVEETFQSIQVVKAFANELLEVLRYRTAMGKVVQAAMKAAVWRGLFVTFIFVAIFGGIILVIWFGARMIQTGEIQVGELISFILYTAFIGGSVAGMGDLYGQLQKTIGASERVREILGETPEFELGETEVPAAQIAGRIEYDQVRFAYPSRPETEVLKGLSLLAQPGEKIALVGHSGAGKSTIVQLLLRFHEAQAGEIRIDGRPVGAYDLPALRKQIGLVPQDVILFGGTIRENIAYGRPGASEQDLIDAARRAYAWEFISGFPEGLDTVVGERGVKLSGGQRQRIAIARAILKDPAILILDEATSSLDAESESLVQAALNELMQGRTTLIIAHRLSTIRQVDRIYVLEDGEVRESGTHEELSAREDGTYSHLLRLQLQIR
ncbi:MAG: ABC transporter transmembrane domain-containing protein [Bacteroidia bacterium]|nr:ABC transporter transmembrane domain-containing protein [Bacteroidia bacterium]